MYSTKRNPLNAGFLVLYIQLIIYTKTPKLKTQGLQDRCSE